MPTNWIGWNGVTTLLYWELLPTPTNTNKLCNYKPTTNANKLGYYKPTTLLYWEALQTETNVKPFCIYKVTTNANKCQQTGLLHTTIRGHYKRQQTGLLHTTIRSHYKRLQTPTNFVTTNLLQTPTNKLSTSLSFEIAQFWGQIYEQPWFLL